MTKDRPKSADYAGAVLSARNTESAKPKLPGNNSNVRARRLPYMSGLSACPPEFDNIPKKSPGSVLERHRGMFAGTMPREGRMKKPAALAPMD
jgi:hypothetical protein